MPLDLCGCCTHARHDALQLCTHQLRRHRLVDSPRARCGDLPGGRGTSAMRCDVCAAAGVARQVMSPRLGAIGGVVRGGPGGGAE
eukprot:7334981-Prymnesium_polylepis.1